MSNIVPVTCKFLRMFKSKTSKTQLYKHSVTSSDAFKIVVKYVFIYLKVILIMTHVGIIHIILLDDDY